MNKIEFIINLFKNNLIEPKHEVVLVYALINLYKGKHMTPKQAGTYGWYSNNKGLNGKLSITRTKPKFTHPNLLYGWTYEFRNPNFTHPNLSYGCTYEFLKENKND